MTKTSSAVTAPAPQHLSNEPAEPPNNYDGFLARLEAAFPDTNKTDMPFDDLESQEGADESSDA